VDVAVGQWKKQAVLHHGYQRYGTIFDREVEWEKKRAVWKKK